MAIYSRRYENHRVILTQTSSTNQNNKHCYSVYTISLHKVYEDRRWLAVDSARTIEIKLSASFVHLKNALETNALSRILILTTVFTTGK